MVLFGADEYIAIDKNEKETYNIFIPTGWFGGDANEYKRDDLRSSFSGFFRGRV